MSLTRNRFVLPAPRMGRSTSLAWLNPAATWWQPGPGRGYLLPVSLCPSASEQSAQPLATSQPDPCHAPHTFLSLSPPAPGTSWIAILQGLSSCSPNTKKERPQQGNAFVTFPLRGSSCAPRVLHFLEPDFSGWFSSTFSPRCYFASRTPSPFSPSVLWLQNLGWRSIGSPSTPPPSPPTSLAIYCFQQAAFCYNTGTPTCSIFGWSCLAWDRLCFLDFASHLFRRK